MNWKEGKFFFILAPLRVYNVIAGRKEKRGELLQLKLLCYAKVIKVS